MGKVLFMMLLCGAAGLVAWAIMEPGAPKIFPSPDWTRWSILFVLTMGAAIGLALGGILGWSQGSKSHLLRGAASGLVLGGFAGVIGYQIGGAIVMALFGPGVLETGSLHPSVIVARMLVFMPIGGMIGLVAGVAARSWPRAVQGMIGGLIGGAIGGVAFDIIGQAVAPLVLAARDQMYGEVGGVSRAVVAVAMGGAIGLFVGVVEMLSRKAWVRLELGRNEGKEWIVDAPRTFIGRSENAHVPLFGDPNVMPMHACIERKSGNYRLIDGGAPMGIGVNGIRVPEAHLNHGDLINVGSFNLRFLLKNPRASAPIVDQARQQAPAAQGLPPRAEPAGFSLVAVAGPITGRRFPLGPAEVVAGRESPEMDLSFDTSASRRHASFIAGDAGVFVRDLGSTNGTMVNGVRVQEMSLRPGDTVIIGSTTFRLEAG